MKNLFLYIGFLGILSLASCETVKLVGVDKCTILTASAICTDPDLPSEDNQNEYRLSFREMRGYQAISPSDYNKLEADLASKLGELAKLRRKCPKEYQE